MIFGNEAATPADWRENQSVEKTKLAKQINREDERDVAKRFSPSIAVALAADPLWLIRGANVLSAKFN